MYAACKWGHARCLRVLVDFKADLIKHKLGMPSPMMIASINGHTDCLKIILEVCNDWCASALQADVQYVPRCNIMGLKVGVPRCESEWEHGC